MTPVSASESDLEVELAESVHDLVLSVDDLQLTGELVAQRGRFSTSAR